MRSFFLWPLLILNRRRHKRIYTGLISLKQAYLNEQDEVKRQSLVQRIVQEHEVVLDQQTTLLPFDSRRILPTRLGNAWAAIEEYPAYRYGMDGVTFWPRLRACVPRDYLEAIDNEAMYARLMINLSFILGCFGIESVIAMFVFHGLVLRTIVTLIALAAGSISAAYMLYRASVGLTGALGELIKSCFDLYRNELLQKMDPDLKPETRRDERKMWISLANFLSTGEDFYYPERQQMEEDSTAKMQGGGARLVTGVSHPLDASGGD